MRELSHTAVSQRIVILYKMKNTISLDIYLFEDSIASSMLLGSSVLCAELRRGNLFFPVRRRPGSGSDELQVNSFSGFAEEMGTVALRSTQKTRQPVAEI